MVLCLAACASRTPAPVEDRTPRPPPPVVSLPAPPPVVEAPPAPAPDLRPQSYTVKRGDTVQKIALDHGLDYRELAAWNNLENINVIRAGQVLRLTAPPTESASAAASAVQTAPLKTVPSLATGDASPAPAGSSGTRTNTETYKSQPKAFKEPYSEQALRDAQRGGTAAASSPLPPEPIPPVIVARTDPKPAAEPPPAVARVDPKPAPVPPDGDEKVDWVWPVKGKILTGFSEAASLKGIDIAGTSGQAIAASAAGKVVYAGTGLRGYGKLIIVKHNATYLSAYAHNKEILVKEGQQVNRGQRIAEMGNTDADQVKLHFEIRRQGKPVDPLRYLPPA